MTRLVYLDHNATAPLKPAVIGAMSAALAETGNASSVHRFGRLARRAVENARADVAALVGARDAQVVFTGGGTEANNLALAGLRGGRRLIVSAIEHDSILAAAPDAEIAPVDASGRVDPAALEELLARDPQPALVAVMLANNETGVIQPMAEIVRLAHARGALVHCDAIQAAGKVAIDFAALSVDSLALSAHKFGGPQGTGALIVADRVELSPLLRGGGQERGRRAGTENIAAIRGFGLAATLAANDLAAMQGLAARRDEMEARLRRVAPGVEIFGADSPRLPNTSCIAMPGVSAETQVMAFDLAGIAVSAGSACSSGKVRPSHVLRAMGVDTPRAATAIRVSLGWRTEAADIDSFVETWTGLFARLSGHGSVMPQVSNASV
ncbi:MAG: cysteine desulfurase [Rhodospirillales bacterium]|nr:cysteine desulfurase [Rhodospirillales bacterium]